MIALNSAIQNHVIKNFNCHLQKNSMKDSHGKFEKYYMSLPVMVKPQLEIKDFKAHKSILYEGEAIFTQNMRGQKGIYKTHITIVNNWFGGDNAEFIISDANLELVEIIDNCNSFAIQDGSIESNGLLITQQKMGRENLLKGIIHNPIIRHFNEVEDKDADMVYFHVFNFRKIIGKHARTHEEHKGGSSIRQIFRAKEFNIELYTPLLSEDEWAGVKDSNYGLTHTGVLKCDDDFKLSKPIVFNILNRFGQFLSFLNGSYCFPKGWIAQNIKEENIWINYTNYITDKYPKCNSWLPQSFNDEIGILWAKFYELPKDEYEIVERIIDWYVQANVRRIDLQSAFISVQIAYEILFNYIVDIKKHVPAERKDSKCASSKIRVLLKFINLGNDMPQKYSEIFEEYLRKYPNYNDFPYLFADVRNSFTHADPFKKDGLKELKKYHLEALLNTGLCYLELLILKIFGYNGTYANRLSQKIWRPKNENIVPWQNITTL